MTKEHLCPETPGELGLDAPSWWSGQRDTIELIVAALLEKKYVMAGIPTGGGKTIIASAVQRILGHVGGGQWGGDSLALTHTIQLQKQYQRTLKDAKVITGRSNHPCELPMDDEHRIGYDEKVPLTADEAPCNGGPCPADLKGPNGCAYYKQWWEAARSPMVVMNYAFATRILRQEYFAGEDGEPMANPFRRTLLVADECHLTESDHGVSGLQVVERSGRRPGCSSEREHEDSRRGVSDGSSTTRTSPCRMGAHGHEPGQLPVHE